MGDATLEKIINMARRVCGTMALEGQPINEDKFIVKAIIEAGYCKVVMGDGGKSYDVYPEANKGEGSEISNTDLSSHKGDIFTSPLQPKKEKYSEE